MRDRDLFYYMFDCNENKYNEFLDLLKKEANFTSELITDDQKIFLGDFYIRLLFQIAVLEYRGYSDDETAKLLNLNESIILFDIEKIQELKRKYRKILDSFYESLDSLYKNVTVEANEEINKKPFNIKRIFKISR